MQDHCIVWAKRDGPVQVRLCAHKVEAVDSAQKAARGVAGGQSWSKRDGLLGGRECTLVALQVAAAVRQPELR